ncbi:MAG TPA: MMPL family transporter [Kofleriaceae bacterium]|nr:MMPL family transporter [Kofleriaceae bacterium]
MSASARYVAWVERRGRAIVAVSAVLVAVSAYLAVFHLPVRADLSDLLPSDVPAIRDLRRLEARLATEDTDAAIVIACDPAERAAAADELAAEIARIEPRLVARVDHDDRATREFIRAHELLYVPVAELQAIAAPSARFELRAKQLAAEAKLARSRYVSADGTAQVIVVDTAFPAANAAADRELQDRLDRIADGVRARHPTVGIAFAGGITQTVAEHDSLVHGMVVSACVTTVLVALVLFVHLRSWRALAVIVANIVAATIVAFGFAALAVGHLNAATAFLGAIIAGNGVNYGILLVARYLEERHASDASDAMARAIAGTLKPTLVASLGAAIAYGALAVTQFKGFADFAIIGGVGMLVCWIASFVLLPALVLRFAARSRGREAPVFGRIALGLFGTRRPRVACAAGAVLALGSAAIVTVYVARDPLEYDMTKLRSDAPAALETRAWTNYVNTTFGRGLTGMSRSSYIAVDELSQVPEVVEALRQARAKDPVVGDVQSTLDAVPPDQPAKLALLARAKLLPPGLHAFTADDLPAELRARLAERDGRIGYLVAVTPGATFDEWNGHDLLRFATAIRELHLAGGHTVTTSGASVIFADLITAIRHDGVVITLVAAAGLVAMVLLLVGPDRRALAVLAASALGSLAMVAACALIGLRVNFLDFVALPIAFGLGIDYGINVAHRADRDDPRIALRSTGGTVLVCSLTTVIGYASLLASSNLAIRGFGLASLLGEVACVVTALALVPAIISFGRRR